MRWFKHMTCAYDDEKLSAAVDLLGMEGYGFFWRILEVVAEKLDETGDCSCTFSSKKWGGFFGFSARKFEKFVRIFAEKRIFSVEFLENSIMVNIPNLLKYKDEWTTKKGRNSGVAPEEVRSKDIEEDKDNIKTPLSPLRGQGGTPGADAPAPRGGSASVKEPYTQEFEAFWKAYPRRTGKDAAFAAWKAKKRERRLPALPVLLQAIEAAKRTEQWQKEGGAFIPHPRTWISQGRWQDEQAHEEPVFRIPDWARSENR